MYLHSPHTLDLPTLRLFSGLERGQAAALAGVSRRTWVRWEQRGHTLAERWLRCEAGFVRAWPNGWVVRPGGVLTPGGHEVPLTMIESAYWIITELRRPALEKQARRRYRRLDLA